MAKKANELMPETTNIGSVGSDFQPISGQTAAEVDVNASSDANASTAGTVAPAPAIKESIPDIEAFLSTLTAEQLAKVRSKVERDTSSAISPQFAARAAKNIDGSLNVMVRLDPVVVEQLEQWAEGEGISLMEEAQNRVGEAISNYIFGDWGATQVKPATAAESAGAGAGAGAGAK